MRLTSRLAVLIFLIASISAGAQDAGFKVSSPEEIKEDFSTIPCEDKKRLEAVKSLFERAGAMINIDSLGLSAPQVADNMSSKKLAQFTEDTAKEMKMPFARATIPGAFSDSIPFVEKNIPGVTIHGMSNEWPKILHSGNDQASKINPLSVYLAYRLSLAMVVSLDQSPCAAYKD